MDLYRSYMICEEVANVMNHMITSNIDKVRLFHI